MLTKGTSTECRYRIGWEAPDYEGKRSFTLPDGSRYEGSSSPDDFREPDIFLA
jgi:hypothetical protein